MEDGEVNSPFTIHYSSFTIPLLGSGLAGGPGELSTGEDVKVEVRDCFAAIGAIIDHGAESRISEPLLAGNELCGE